VNPEMHVPWSSTEAVELIEHMSAATGRPEVVTLKLRGSGTTMECAAKIYRHDGLATNLPPGDPQLLGLINTPDFGTSQIYLQGVASLSEAVNVIEQYVRSHGIGAIGFAGLDFLD
jgi:hypothetical protein